MRPRLAARRIEHGDETLVAGPDAKPRSCAPKAEIVKARFARIAGADAASDIRPAGLRNGVDALAASVSTDPAAAMVGDLAALGAAIAPIGARRRLPSLRRAP
jgi:hypothetical protein